MPIRILPPLLVNQIAAGEVVERPANVVKELLENALDAEATRIEVETDAGGCELIRVTDDGCGIPPDELPLAVAAHATSKISTLEELAAVRSMGFRGEALASIAAVSRLRLLSRQRGAGTGALLEGEGDRFEAVRPAAAPPGTTVTVRNLFFNTPARRRFLKSESAEAGRITEMVTAAALAHPQVGFRLIHGGRVVLDLPVAPTRRERIGVVVGRELAGELLDLGSEHGARGLEGSSGSSTLPRAVAEGDRWLRVGGVAGRPAAARPNARHLRLYVNGRPVVDRMLSHAVREAYRGLIDPSRYPTAVIFVELDPHEVDVNVHPTKAEVRFRNGSAVHVAVQRAVQSALRAADLVPEIRLSERMPSFGGTGGVAPGWADMLHRRADGGQAAIADATSAHQAPPPMESGGMGSASGAATGVPFDSTATDAPGASATPFLQVRRKYVVTEDDAGLVIVDQHALHERAMFERFHSRLGRGPLESQRLLIPAGMAVDRPRLEVLDEHTSLLVHLGFEIVPAGPESILIHAIPTLLHSRGVDAMEFLGEFLDRAGAGELPAEREAALVEVLSMMACKAAVKAGDALTQQELAELLRQREQIDRSTACPHGRPTTLRITLEELDRWFGR